MVRPPARRRFTATVWRCMHWAGADLPARIPPARVALRALLKAIRCSLQAKSWSGARGLWPPAWTSTCARQACLLLAIAAAQISIAVLLLPADQLSSTAVVLEFTWLLSHWLYSLILLASLRRSFLQAYGPGLTQPPLWV